MKVIFLGTGTSQGVPIIGCTCDTCMSEDVQDKRLRSSVLISTNETNILIDIGPDFRQQMLANKVNSIDAVLITHEHNDHVIGIDDIRPFNFKQKINMPIYALERVINDIKNKFSYIFATHPYPGTPKLECHPILENQIFEIGNHISVHALPVMHGILPILGFRIGHFAYITDASYIDPTVMESLKGLDVLVLNALQYRPHYSHFTFDQAVAVAQKLDAGITYFTHISHDLGRHKDIITKLPSNIRPAYDGLTIHIS